jgi:hypothetical protein
MTSDPKDLEHEGQKSYAGEWGDDPKDQPPGAAAQAAHHKMDPERPIAVPAQNDEGEADENLVGDRRPRSD